MSDDKPLEQFTDQELRDEMDKHEFDALEHEELMQEAERRGLEI